MASFIVVPEFGVAYGRIPKVASSTILNAFAMALGRTTKRDSHALEWPIQPMCEVGRELHRFAVVRNPYARLVSYWARRRERFLRGHVVPPTAIPVTANTAFHEFLELALVGNPEEHPDSHVLPQAYLLDDGRWLDRIIRFEYLETDWYLLCQAYVRVPLLSKQLNRSTHGPWLGYYNQKMLDKVYELYETDFKLFGYQRAHAS